jgi:hypothetical protein
MVVNRPKRLWLMIGSSLGALLLYAVAFGEIIFKNSFEGTHRVVRSAADSGPGTLRQALLEAQDNDIITFDPAVFPPAAPVTISVTSALPGIHRNGLILDASNAGVELDGRLLSGDWQAGLALEACNGTNIRGLRIVNFSGPGIYLSGGARNNVIGGDRSVGAGPFGQGNQFVQNSEGVFVANPGTTRNVIKGNLIGTDAAATAQLGNERGGLAITEGASGNTIGPDNIIAHNASGGIYLHGKNTVSNTITRNSIHDNGFNRGIQQWVGANRKLIFPSLLDFDLSMGTVVGVTCSNCTVEFFSDDSWDGMAYEGKAVADGGGAFSFDKSAAFMGPNVTATATDLDGSTSEFSPPVSGASRILSLQQSNQLARNQIQPRHAEHNADNRMGMNAGLGPENRAGGLSEDWVEVSKNRVGGTWALGLTIDEKEWATGAEYGYYSEYYIDPSVNKAITQLSDLGFEMVYSLAFWDELIEPEPCYARFRTEEEIQRYLDYIQWLVHNFKDRIQVYEMINEPRYNPCSDFDQQNIDIADYIALVKRVIPTIHQEYPAAKLVVGAVVLRHQASYLNALLESDIMPLVDGISWHPFYGESPEYDSQYYYDYPNTVQEIKDLAAANGFNGEFSVQEMGWGTSDYSEVGAAKYLARGILLHLGMDVVAGYGGSEPWPDEQLARFRVARNLGTVMDEVRAASLPVQIQPSPPNTAIYTFAHGDDKLVGLWTDGIAMDHDPGVPATVTIQGLGEYSATAIDVLHGYRQPLITENEGGNLVIRDLLVLDYPILLRLSAP